VLVVGFTMIVCAISEQQSADVAPAPMPDRGAGLDLVTAFRERGTRHWTTLARVVR
jgi:hypothetical protein